MMRLLCLALLALATTLPTTEAESDIALTIDNAKCNNPWSVTDFSYSCDSNGCNFGEQVQVSGTLDVSSAFTTGDVDVSLKITMFGFQVAQTTQDICSVIAASDVECGEAGTYTFETNVPIPDENALTNVLMQMTGNYLTVKATIGDITTCSARVNKVQSGSSMSMVATSVLVGTLIVGAGFYAVRRKRRIIQDESLKRTLTDFEMAPDPWTRAVQV